MQSILSAVWMLEEANKAKAWLVLFVVIIVITLYHLPGYPEQSSRAASGNNFGTPFDAQSSLPRLPTVLVLEVSSCQTF